MAIVLSGTTNDILVNGVSVATDAEVSSAVANGVAPKANITYVDSQVTTAVPAGTIITVAKNTAPTGYLKANGALLSRTTYSDLFAQIGTTFGVGDGSTTFALPDLRGLFPRGWDDGRGIDVGRVFGSKQEDIFKAHYHLQGDAHQNPVGRFGATPDIGASVNAQSSNATDAYNTSTVGGTETRPKNIALLYCIKY